MLIAYCTPGGGNWNISDWLMVGMDACKGNKRNRVPSLNITFAFNWSISFEISSHPGKNTRIAPTELVLFVQMCSIMTSTCKTYAPYFLVHHCLFSTNISMRFSYNLDLLINLSIYISTFQEIFYLTTPKPWNILVKFYIVENTSKTLFQIYIQIWLVKWKK